jgi:hypothetical protein
LKTAMLPATLIVISAHAFPGALGAQQATVIAETQHRLGASVAAIAVVRQHSQPRVSTSAAPASSSVKTAANTVHDLLVRLDGGVAADAILLVRAADGAFRELGAGETVVVATNVLPGVREIEVVWKARGATARQFVPQVRYITRPSVHVPMVAQSSQASARMSD